MASTDREPVRRRTHGKQIIDGTLEADNLKFVKKFQDGDRAAFTLRKSFAGDSDAAGGILSYRNTLGYDVLVQRLDLIILTQSTGACTVDAGVTPTNATTSADNLIDGASVAAAGTINNISNAGTNGKGGYLLKSGEYLNISRASGASAGLVGTALISVVKV